MSKRDTSHVLSEALEKVGLRSTRQRELVFDVLMSMHSHPTADEVFVKARESMSSISLATVYNCLETLVDCHLVKAVNWERESTRYCANLREHAHLHDKFSGKVVDVELPEQAMQYLLSLVPQGYEVDSVELSFIGRPVEPSGRSVH